MSNFTVDDNASTLRYGPGWGVASPNDPNLDSYFESSYHASDLEGANVTVTFVGSAIYLFGSKGPGHGQYSVHFDDLVETLSAASDTEEYQQLLFSKEFVIGTHTITLTNTDSNNRWLDLDFVTFATDSGNTSSITTHGFSSTISPLILPTSSSIASMISSSTTPLPTGLNTSQSSSSTTSTNATLILAVVFGVLLFFLLVSVLWYIIRRRIRKRPPPTPSTYPKAPSSLAPESIHAPGSAFLGPQDFASPMSLQQHSQLDVASPVTSGSSKTTNTHTLSPLLSDAGSGSGSGVQQWGSLSAHSAIGSQQTDSRPWSPFPGPLKHMFKGSPKYGADSMKSTFLQV